MHQRIKQKQSVHRVVDVSNVSSCYVWEVAWMYLRDGPSFSFLDLCTLALWSVDRYKEHQLSYIFQLKVKSFWSTCVCSLLVYPLISNTVFREKKH